MGIFGRLGVPGTAEKKRGGEEGHKFHGHQPDTLTEQGRPDTGLQNILVALQGIDNELDDELVRLACYMAKQRKGRVFAVYGIEVPRTLPVDAELPEQAAKATSVLDRAVATAERLNFTLEPEIVQSRSWGASLVDEAEAHNCALIIMGIAYQIGRSGRFELGEAVPYVLTHARCRVWVIRAAQRADARTGDQQASASYPPGLSDRRA